MGVDAPNEYCFDADVPRSSILPLVDRLIPGGVEKYLTDARNAGQSYDTIAARLYAEHDISATGSTVSAWCKSYKIKVPA